MTKRQPKLSLWSQLPKWAWKQGLRNNIDFSRNPDSSGGRPERERPQHCSDIKQAQVITSRIEYPEQEDTHKPVLDIDFPAAVIPSTTEGHFHLYLDKELTWTQYRRLLDALTDCGIIEQGYRNASIARGYTSVRVPWVRKEAITEDPAPEPTPEAPAPQEATQPRAEPLPDVYQPTAADPILRNIAAAYASTTVRNDMLEEERRLATQAALNAVNHAPNPAPERGPVVRYNPMLMRFEDGTNWVSDHFMHLYGGGLEPLISQGAVVANSIGWLNIVREYGHPIARRTEVLREEEGVREAPMVSGTIRYEQSTHTFRITGAHAEGEEPRRMSISETFYRERIMGGASLPTGLQARLNRMGFEGRPVRRLFDSAYRPGRSIHGVLPADTPSDAQIERNRAEVSAHYTRVPAPSDHNITVSWEAPATAPTTTEGNIPA